MNLNRRNTLHLIAALDPELGGVSKAVLSIIDGLGRENVDNEIVSLDDPDAPYLKNKPFVIHALGPAKSPWRYSRQLYPWLVNNIARFDVIILHGLWLYSGYAMNKALKIVRARILFENVAQHKIPKFYIMPHGMLDPYFQKATDRRAKALRNWVYWKIVESKVVNNSNGLLFTSSEELALAKQTFTPYSPKLEIVVGLGIEFPPSPSTEMLQAFQSKVPEAFGHPYLLFLSRIHVKKGIENLLMAYMNLTTQFIKAVGGSETNAYENLKKSGWPKLVIAGPGLDTTYGLQLQNTVSSSEIFRQMIYFPGMLHDNLKWGALYGCDAFILPSHQENFGIAVTEALGCGKLVLITNRVNIWKDIADYNCGLISESTLQGTEELIRTWKELTQTEKSEMSKNATILFQEKFHISCMTKGFLEIINMDK